MSLYFILIIVFSIIFFLGVIGFIVTRSKKKDDSELGIFHHPSNFKKAARYKKTGKAGIFAGSLELVKEGSLKMKQEELFDDIYIRENK